MKNYIRKIAFGLVMVMASITAGAQDYNIDGYLMSRSWLTPTDITTLSQYSSTYGTARSVAMGGAFTSLGGDLYSISSNPAGLGLYLSSEVSFTPAVVFGNVSSNFPGESGRKGGNRSRFVANSYGTALNLYQGGGTLTSFTFGLSYNRLADFNYKSSVRNINSGVSIYDAFANQLYGLQSSALNGSSPWNNLGIDLSEWGAVLGYKTYVLEPRLDDEGNETGVYDIMGLGNALTDSYTDVYSRGGIGEYNFAGGFNFSNKFYVGLTFSFLDIYRKQSVIHREHYHGDFGTVPEADRLTDMGYGQHTRESGWGFNMKIGAIYRPIPELRIGLAYHTPTWTAIRRHYGADMETFFPYSLEARERYVYSSSYEAISDYDYRTPSRLMAGVSYTFGGIGIISVDYERVWYNSTKLTSGGGAMRDYYNSFFKNEFQGSNIIRTGLEVRPVSTVALRAGFAYQDSFLVNDNIFNSPMPYESLSISGGVGFNLTRSWTLDLAYAYNQIKMTDYNLFVYQDSEVTIPDNYLDRWVSSKMKRHNVMLSIRYRF